MRGRWKGDEPKVDKVFWFGFVPIILIGSALSLWFVIGVLDSPKARQARFSEFSRKITCILPNGAKAEWVGVVDAHNGYWTVRDMDHNLIVEISGSCEVVKNTEPMK